jgi:hypothetical protein
VFLQTGGSITDTLRSIITGPEFFSAQNFQTKVRTPFEFVAAALRATGSETDANRPILDWISRMGQPVYGRVTPDGYPDKSDQWLSNNDLLARFNFAAALATNKINGTKLDPAKVIDKSIADDPSAIAARLISILLLDQASPTTRESLDKIVAKQSANKVQDGGSLTPVSTTGKPAAPNAVDNVRELIALTLGTPDFQKK